MKILTTILIAILVISCREKEIIYRQEAKFQEMLDNLELNCVNEDSDAFFKATIKGIETCYYDGINNMQKELSYTDYFVTESPSFTTGEISDAGHTIIFGITLDLEKGGEYQNWVGFSTPPFDVNISKEAYLDSLFSIPYHNVIDRNVKEGIKVTLNMYDKKQASGGSVYSFYSETGYQDDDSYIHFKKAEKKTEFGFTYYDIEMEVQCGLFYHKNDDFYTQYGKEGLWGELENGLLKMKVKL